MKMPNGEVLVQVDAQGRTTDLRALGVTPGDLYLGHLTSMGYIVLEPARVVRCQPHQDVVGDGVKPEWTKEYEPE